MEVYVKALLKDLESEIERLKNEKTNYLFQVIELIENNLEHLKIYVQTNEFKSDQEEIYFFKYLKPRFCSLLIFYLKINDFQTNKPIGDFEQKKNYIEDHLNRINIHFNKNRSFYNYIINDNVNFDEVFFIRINAKRNLTYESFNSDLDFRFCTGYDQQVSMYIASKKMEEYLENELDLLMNPEKNSISYLNNQNTHYETDYEKFNLHWTESQSALTELIYALHESKVFNEGETTILDITKCFEMAFNVRLSNVHRSFVEIKNRKNERLKFLDGLVNRLNSFIERSFQK